MSLLALGNSPQVQSWTLSFYLAESTETSSSSFKRLPSFDEKALHENENACFRIVFHTVTRQVSFSRMIMFGFNVDPAIDTP